LFLTMVSVPANGLNLIGVPTTFVLATALPNPAIYIIRMLISDPVVIINDYLPDGLPKRPADCPLKREVPDMAVVAAGCEPNRLVD
jgi:hypothetical protein